MAEEKNIALLAQIPIVQGICDSGDDGAPVALRDNTVLSDIFRTLAERVAAAVEQPAKQ